VAIDLIEDERRVSETARTAEYQAITAGPPTHVQVELSPELVKYIDLRARELNLSFELTANFIMAQGIRLAKQARSFSAKTIGEGRIP